MFSLFFFVHLMKSSLLETTWLQDGHESGRHQGDTILEQPFVLGQPAGLVNVTTGTKTGMRKRRSARKMRKAFQSVCSGALEATRFRTELAPGRLPRSDPMRHGGVTPATIRRHGLLWFAPKRLVRALPRVFFLVLYSYFGVEDNPPIVT